MSFKIDANVKKNHESKKFNIIHIQYRINIYKRSVVFYSIPLLGLIFHCITSGISSIRFSVKFIISRIMLLFFC